ncbi:MAG: ABC transporter substrate-binding protein [Deltaproteobacteria bacterium]
MKFLVDLKWTVFLLGIVCSVFAGPATVPHRVITTSPALTEIVFEIGHGDTLVAASQYSDFPEAAKSLPRIGSLFLPSLEKVLSFKPTWVLIDKEATPPLFSQQLETLKLNTLEISIRSISDLFKEAQRIDHFVFQCSFSPDVEKMRNRFFETLKSHQKHFTFIALAWDSPVYAVGTSTFLSDLLSQIGGKNLIPAGLPADYPQVSQEWLIKHPPDILFMLHETKDYQTQLRMLATKWWPGIKTKVVILESQFFARTSFAATDRISQLLESEL